jgi:intein/homing endonuclease
LKLQKSGTNQKPELNGTKNTLQEATLESLIMEQTTVFSATVNTEEELNTQSFAIQTVKLNTFVKGESWSEAVYDLTVEDAHEYFANGILVHNCLDALRYATLTRLTKKRPSWVGF